MSTALRHGPIDDPNDFARFQAISEQCFRFPSSYWAPYVANMGRENFRGVWRDNEIVGGYGVYRVGQFFGRRRLELAAIAVVGVPPEERALGIAAEMMTASLRELRDIGTPLAALFASTQRVYRKVGYEQAGSRVMYRVATADFPRTRERLPAQPVAAVASEDFRRIYLEWARRTNGQLDRSDGLWSRVLRTMEAPIVSYTVGEPGKPEGYVVFEHSGGFGRPQEIEVRDLIAATPRALATIFSLLGDHRSTARTSYFYGSQTDPRLALFAEETWKVSEAERWMLRIVDVAGAFGGRGYAPSTTAELHLEVDDDILPENSGRWRLRVAGGRGEVTAGGEGRMRISARGLAPLFSGYFNATMLADLGWLEADPDSIEAADAIFAGPETWMADGF